MPTYPLPTLGVTIGPNGITAPAYEDILNSLIATFQGIYGSDVLLNANDQDNQWIVTIATAQNDTNNAVIDVYNSGRLSGAQGAGLSALVLLLGLRRQGSTNSTVDLTITGTAGTILNNAVAQDSNGNLWNIPNGTTIPAGGTITVTATAQTAGDITADPNTVTVRYTPLRGWDTVTNPAAAAPGTAVELDGVLYQRALAATSLPAQTPLSSIAAVVAQVAGVSRSKVYENQYATPDSNGIPGHSVAAVVLGGDAVAIAQAIETKKSPGTGTYGTTTEIVEDPSGVPIPISFFVMTQTQIYVDVTIQPLDGYVSTTGDALIAAIVAFLNALVIGEEVYYAWMYGPAQLYGSPLGLTYRVTALTIGFTPSPSGTADLPIAFNAAATCSTPNVVLTVL